MEIILLTLLFIAGFNLGYLLGHRVGRNFNAPPF